MRPTTIALLVGSAALVTASACQPRSDVPPAGHDDEPDEPLAAETRASEATLAAVARRAIPAPAGACPDDMVLIEGDYCPDVELNCRRYLDPKGRYRNFRCAEYGPSTCRSSERRPMRYCIDRQEYTPPGAVLPANHKSFTHAEATCSALGRRVCLESEWNFACEGEEMRPYPYGFVRDAEACNADRKDILGTTGKLRDLRAPAGSHPRCASPFGVLDMAGNLEEFVAIDGATPVRPAMKGAYWQPGRNSCRAAQTAHDRYYNGTETGFRCCDDAAAE